MGLIGWLRQRGGPREDRRLRGWREEWAHAARDPDAERARLLRAALDGFALPDEEVEIEREMVEALDDAAGLAAAVRAGGLPLVETGHRVVGTDRCHFSAPASMPDDPAQPSGRLLLTSGRAIFVGGTKGTSAPWHSIREVVHGERDVLLIAADRDRLYRFRCNSFADALRAAMIARQLVADRRAPRPGL